MSASTHSPLAVLMLSPHPSVPGGVSCFAQMLKTHLRACTMTSLWVGRRYDTVDNTIRITWRLIGIPLQVIWQVWRDKIDVVHLNPSLNAKSCIRDGFILLALRCVGFSRTLVYFHGWEAKTATQIESSPLLRHTTAWLLNGAARVTVLSPAFKIVLESCGVAPENITVTRMMYDQAALTVFDQAPALPAERQRILFLSRFEAQKGLHDLLKAFSALAADYPNLDLIFAGGGDEKEALQNHVKKIGLDARIQVLDYVQGATKARLLHDCTIFALPTYYGEGMPIALLEALAAGKPVLTSAIGGISSVIRQPDNGVVLPHINAALIEQGLRRLLNDPVACARIGQHNATYARTYFDATVIRQEIENMYKQIVA